MREIGDQSYIIGKTDGSYWAVSAQCTYKDFLLIEVMDDKGCLVCTKHGAQFEPNTGKRLRDPINTTDLPTFDVINDNGTLLINGINVVWDINFFGRDYL